MRLNDSLWKVFIFLISARIIVGREELTIVLGVSINKEANHSLCSLDGLTFFKEWYNELGDEDRTMKINSALTRVSVDTHVEYDDGTLEGTIYNYKAMSKNRSITFLLAPPSSEFAYNVREALLDERKLMVSNSVSYLEWTKLPGSYSVMPSIYTFSESILYFSTITEIQKVFIVSTELKYLEYQCKFIRKFLGSSGYTILDYAKLPTPAGRDSEGMGSIFENLADRIMRSDLEMLICCTDFNDSIRIMEDLRNKDFTPKSVIFPAMNEYKVGTWGKDLFEFTLFSTSYEKQINMHLDNKLNCTSFGDEFLRKFGYEPHTYQLNMMVACLLFIESIMQFGTLEEEVLAENIPKIVFRTFANIVSFSYNKWQQVSNFIIQRQLYTNVVVYPVSSNRMVYPIPTWTERRERDYKMTYSSIASFSINAFGASFSMACIIFVVNYHRHEFIRSLSVGFLLLYLLGSMLLYFSCIASPPEFVSEGTCIAKYLLIPIAFNIMYSSLVVKVFQMYLLYTRLGLKQIKISFLKVTPLFLAMVTIQLIHSILIVTLGDLKRSYRVTDVFRPLYNHKICNYNETADIIFTSNIIYTVISFLLGIAMTYRLRKLTIKTYINPEIFGFLFYTLSFTMMIYIMMEGIFERVEIYLVKQICIFMGNFATTCTMFVPRIYKVIMKEKELRQMERVKRELERYDELEKEFSLDLGSESVDSGYDPERNAAVDSASQNSTGSSGSSSGQDNEVYPVQSFSE